jgi:hypothetical protein
MMKTRRGRDKLARINSAKMKSSIWRRKENSKLNVRKENSMPQFSELATTTSFLLSTGP